MLKLNTLLHCGVMVNYRCTAACRHCLYACSPTRCNGYVTAEKMEEISMLLKKGRIGSVHIGGGEPFLDFEGLCMAIRALSASGIVIDYVETNAFWANGKEAPARIEALMRLGIDTLCISLDPYHAEYVPYKFPLGLAELCDRLGMGYFLWQRQFLPALSRLSGDHAHSRVEMEKALSPRYIRETAARYGISFGGRAVNIEEEYASKRRPPSELISNEPCGNLLSTGHFHVDLAGYFIPPNCTGLRLPLSELLEGIDEDRYPVYAALYNRGIAGLVELAKGFKEDERGYASKCNLCFHLRRYLAEAGYAELDREHYAESLEYY